MIDRSFYEEPKRLKVSELAAICGFEVVGNGDFEISGVATLKNASCDELSFLGNNKYIGDLKNTSAGAVIVAEANLEHLPQNVVGLVYANATIGYAKALKVMYPEEVPAASICATASIHETSRIGANCNIGDYVVLEENVEIGDHVAIGSNSVIGKGCKIGSGCKIRHNVTISHSILGNDVLVNSGARIGESGFGIVPTGKEMVFVRQLGRVIIGNRVRVGANATIDRGSIQDTVIGDDTIIDNLVQIGHNVTIGERSILVAQVGIAGSTKIGNDVVLAGQVGVSGHIEIGDKAIAAAKSGIASSVGAGKIVGGIPAVDANIWKRQAAFLKMAVTRKKQER
ncbi:MAG: UDP-3-O-(3-hydroxymyristoyl)glucosamine N-acyltransferase [Holosporaceae bacterium]|jgi:UDP-3-O-[3-hydroxymyristoyl] glucosamine N-acyltransferase|nr:UDP-3-O-(3-hydroxymyristoyl)glucosamine N-acyltransferase [Holosporaceae bacterium]